MRDLDGKPVPGYPPERDLAEHRAQLNAKIVYATLRAKSRKMGNTDAKSLSTEESDLLEAETLFALGTVLLENEDLAAGEWLRTKSGEWRDAWAIAADLAKTHFDVESGTDDGVHNPEIARSVRTSADNQLQV